MMNYNLQGVSRRKIQLNNCIFALRNNINIIHFHNQFQTQHFEF